MLPLPDSTGLQAVVTGIGPIGGVVSRPVGPQGRFLPDPDNQDKPAVGLPGWTNRLADRGTGSRQQECCG